MKITVDITLQTDGDYRLDNYEGYDIVHEEGSYLYYGTRVFEYDKETRCVINARSYLSGILCDIRVLNTHYYIIKDIYDMFERAIEFVEKREEGSVRECIFGNYDGTELEVTIEGKE